MSQQKSKLHKTLWDIANTLRGNMGADEFRDYILGFIFYKYLSERTLSYANSLLAPEGKDYKSLPSDNNDRYIAAIRTEALSSLGYFLLPNQLFSSVVEDIKTNQAFIIDRLPTIFNSIEQSTASEDEFERYLDEEKKKELDSICKANELHFDKVEDLISDMLYYGNVPSVREVMMKTFINPPSLFERDKAIAGLTEKLDEFLETFYEKAAS